MNTVSIIIKEFKQNIRNWKANIMMVLFPIILIIILGAAFSGVFERQIDLSGVKVLYTLQGSQEMNAGFVSFANGMGGSLGLTFEETSDVQKGINSVKESTYACYIQVGGNSNEIKIYKNARYDFDANMVQSLLNMFTERYGALAAVATTRPDLLGKLMADTSMDFVKTVPLDKRRQPGSLDYYAVAMLTLILMYASLTGFWGFKEEQNMKTGNRILCAPVRKHQVLVGKVLGGILVTIVQALAVYFFSRLILKADWGPDFATIMLLVVAESIMAISIGAGLAFLVKNEGAASGLINTIIPVVVFFGGGYVPLSVMGESIRKISVFSPLKWLNDAMFRVIYSSDYSTVFTAVLICLAVAAAFITVSAVFSRREAA